MGSCWNREDMSLNGSAASWSTDEEDEEEAGDVTSSKESDSNDEPLEVSETEEDELEESKDPTISSYSRWTGPFLWDSIMGLFICCCSISLICSSDNTSIVCSVSDQQFISGQHFTKSNTGTFFLKRYKYKWNGRLGREIFEYL